VAIRELSGDEKDEDREGLCMDGPEFCLQEDVTWKFGNVTRHVAQQLGCNLHERDEARNIYLYTRDKSANTLSTTLSLTTKIYK
jgi:hypothetical protein